MSADAIRLLGLLANEFCVLTTAPNEEAARFHPVSMLMPGDPRYFHDNACSSINDPLTSCCFGLFALLIAICFPYGI